MNLENGILAVNAINGLCNRLRTVLSFKILAEKLKREYCVYWGYSKEFDDSKFNDLFDSSIGLNFIDEDQWNDLAKNSFSLDKVVEFKFNDKEKKFVKEFLSTIKLNEFKVRNKNISFKGARTYLDLLHQKDKELAYGYADRIKELYALIKPSRSIERAVSDFLKDIDPKHLYGFHIRRGDAAKSPWSSNYLKSSDAVFFKKADEIFQSEERAKIYLATDDEVTLNNFKKKYGRKIIAYDKVFYPSNWQERKDGQKEAAIELFLLAKSLKLYGTNWSSFSKTAALLGNIELEVLIENKETNPVMS